MTIARVPLRKRRGASVAFLIIGLLLLLAFSLNLLGPLQSSWMLINGVFAIGAIAYAVLRYKPTPRWNWWVVCFSLLLFLVGGVFQEEMHTLANVTNTRALLPDMITMPGYPLLAIGMLGFTKRHEREGRIDNLDAVLDGLMVALSVMVFSSVYLIGPHLAQLSAPMHIRIILSSYPSMSAFLVVVLIRLAYVSDARKASAYWLLLAAFVSMFAGDLIYMLADARVAHFSTVVLGLPYSAAYIFAGACALDPSMAVLSSTRDTSSKSYSRIQSGLIALALSIPAFMIFGERNASILDRVLVFCVELGLVGVATSRVLRAIKSSKRSEMDLAYAAAHDALTGLPNRRLLEERLSRLLVQASATHATLALVFIDLDQFKMINDSFGHNYGDRLLMDVADRLRANVRRQDIVARLGGDEFLVVLQDIDDVDLAYQIAGGLRDCLHEPFHLDENRLFITGSIGLAMTDPEKLQDAEELLRNADTAMYQAKNAGRDTVVIFDTSMQAEVAKYLEMKYDLRNAIERDELFLVYQPIVTSDTFVVEGAEALVRWQHPTLGLIPPSTFIPLAEESGLILGIGDWVIKTAIAKMAELQKLPEIGPDFYLAVNLSAAQLVDEHLADRIQEILDANGVNGNRICIELTESMVMENPLTSAEILHTLKDHNLRLAIDDFGSGYSSLAYLTKFPVDKLKVDKSFVDSMVKPDSADATLISAIVAMARSLRISTTAEGVETPDQARRLRVLGCDSLQGYFLSRPVPADDFIPTIRRLQSRRHGLTRVISK